MNKTRNFKAFGAVAIAALSLTGTMLLSGCEERPYPTAAKTYHEPKAPPPAQLAGAPAYAPPVYAPQPAPPPAYASQPAYNYPQQRSYDPPTIVAMAPIPNPGEAGSDGYYAGGRRVHSRVYAQPAYGEGFAPPPRHPTYHNPAPVYAPKPVVPPKVYAAKPPVPAKPYSPPPAYAAKEPAVAAAAHAVVKDVKPAAVVASNTYNDKKAPPAAPVTPAKVGQDVKAVGAAAVAATAMAAHDAKAAYNGAKPTPPAAPAAPAPTGDRSTRLASLQSALTDAISKGAVLKAPERFTANQPADVTLTIPAGFADTLRGEAQKDGLADAAASVNMTSVLSGDGFSVTPDETQSQPLTVGQATEFRWTVTAQPGAKGPLHADIGADLLGGGSDTLALGSVQKAGSLGVKLTPRVVGAAILVLILALVVVWLARGRGPSRSASARRASRSARAGGARPLDMGEGAPH